MKLDPEAALFASKPGECSYLQLMVRIVSILPLFLLLIACGEHKRTHEKTESVTVEPGLFHLAHAFTDDEFNVSFPQWFNDSVIRHHRIHTITRKSYFSDTEMDTTDFALREVKVYTFNSLGYLEALYIEHYYDQTLVGSMSFNFDDPDEYGYAQVSPRKGTHSREDEEILAQYHLYDKQKYGEKFLVYEDLESGNYLFYMLREENWGPLSVDSILNPTRNDLIVLGTPRLPYKRYQVENRVNEFNVVRYERAKSDLTGISFDKYPFHYERSLLFDKKGVCTGYVDSTFSGEKYLTRRESLFRFEKELPVSLLHENKNNRSASGYYQMETFEYTFFE